jgi:hypothetical protein
MKEQTGKVIYVGKAINLRSRVRSYFHLSAGHTRKIEKLVRMIQDIEWIVVGSELEALILEMNLIKYRPTTTCEGDKRYHSKVHWVTHTQGDCHRQMVPDGSLLAHTQRVGGADPGRAAAHFPPYDRRSPVKTSAPACTTTSSCAARRASA